ncbi:MAG TPA: hypothetical protein VEI02_03915 [Planctomycetota bacterium]|nr:hypothetical protein [Planctomycetota bacterium]
MSDLRISGFVRRAILAAALVSTVALGACSSTKSSSASQAPATSESHAMDDFGGRRSDADCDPRHRTR